MGPGDTVHGEVCPSEWIYHRIDMTGGASETDYGDGHRQLASGAALSLAELEGKHVELSLEKHTGDFSFLTRVADHAPTRLTPPYRTMATEVLHDSAIFCSLHLGDIYWLALVGGSHCSSYDLEVRELPPDDARCASGEYELERNECGSSTELTMERTAYGSCMPNEYIFYELPLTFARDSDANLRLQLELRSEVDDPAALALLVYLDGEVPIDRETEYFSVFATDKIFTVSIPVVDLQYRLCQATACADRRGCAGYCADGNGTAAHRRLGASTCAAGATTHDLMLHVGVRCGLHTSGQFKLLASKTASHASDRWTHGEVCPGNFFYHHWEHSSAGERRDVRFEIVIHTGDMSAMVRRAASFAEAPLKLAPPNLPVEACHSRAHIDLCQLQDEHSEHGYLALVGGQHCVSYEVRAIDITDEGTCVELGHDSAHAAGQLDAKAVVPHHFEYGSCKEGEWVDYSLTLQSSDAHYNYLIEVEDLLVTEGKSNNPAALSLHLYVGGHVPDDRHTPYSTSLAFDSIYSLAINAHNFQAGTSVFSVKCEPYVSTRQFRVVVYQIESELELGKQVHGEVCPQEWVFHSYQVRQGILHPRCWSGLLPSGPLYAGGFAFHQPVGFHQVAALLLQD